MCEIELARNLDIQNVSDMMAIAREVRGKRDGGDVLFKDDRLNPK